jgi:fibronectin type 3 domain-containing protein
MRAAILLALIFAFCATAAAAPRAQQTSVVLEGGVNAWSYSVGLSWTASSSSGVVGYNVYRSTTSGSGYAKLTASPIAGVAYTDWSTALGETYFYVVTAVNSAGVESAYSTQASAAIPSTIPTAGGAGDETSVGQ